ncbi:Uncharacterized protein TCM_035139 [Theobroma cacao]|uniref:Uncharacterized protein n=1 Tax=Theobroma cacao TaxID=3641 RepID=A0A061FHD5_THECC|nr:Uncharacterized protein TCM_035139 [Theobroma cacao]
MDELITSLQFDSTTPNRTDRMCRERFEPRARAQSAYVSLSVGAEPNELIDTGCSKPDKKGVLACLSAEMSQLLNKPLPPISDPQTTYQKMVRSSLTAINSIILYPVFTKGLKIGILPICHVQSKFLATPLFKTARDIDVILLEAKFQHVPEMGGDLSQQRANPTLQAAAAVAEIFIRLGSNIFNTCPA